MPEEKPNTPDEQHISTASHGEEPISLVEGEGEGRSTSVRAFGAAAARVAKASVYKRAMNLTGQGATRCRLFHSKIAVAALEGMEHQINQWLDNEEIEIKHVGHLVGTMQGKTPELNVIVLAWY